MEPTTASTQWLEGLVLDLSYVDVMFDLDPAALAWEPDLAEVV